MGWSITFAGRLGVRPQPFPFSPSSNAPSTAHRATPGTDSVAARARIAVAWPRVMSRWRCIAGGDRGAHSHPSTLALLLQRRNLRAEGGDLIL